MNSFQTIYEALGSDQIKLLTSNFYNEVAKKPALRKLYPEDLKGAEERLFLFLVQVFGGPGTYSEQRGHPRLRMRHFKWAIDQNLRDLWLEAMFTSMDQLGMPPEVKEALLHYFTNTANHMVNHE